MVCRVVLAPERNESHSDLLESLGIDDTDMNASKVFVRAELTPPNHNKAADISKWTYKVDQDILPDWYEENPGRYEQEFRDAISEYLKENFLIICGHAWYPIKTDEMGTYYLMDGNLGKSEFGENNNYAESDIRKNLNHGELAEQLKKEFGDRLAPITTNLLSLDGLDDYGVVEGDILALPTIDLYRECRKKITNLYTWWWLATPFTPSGCGGVYLQIVVPSGYVDYDKCFGDGAVRPFFILKS